MNKRSVSFIVAVKFSLDRIEVMDFQLKFGHRPYTRNKWQGSNNFDGNIKNPTFITADIYLPACIKMCWLQLGVVVPQLMTRQFL